MIDAKRVLAASVLGISLIFGGSAAAVDVQVTVEGEVEFNLINNGIFASAAAGDLATVSFTVDSNQFTDSPTFPVRGYPIDPSSFTLNIGAISVPIESPLPPGSTPYFSIRNDDPAVDGFLITDQVAFPNGVPLEAPGIFGSFRNNFSVTYGGGTLASFDILAAVGTYDFTGLMGFNWVLNDGPADAMGLIFSQMTISTGPAPELFVRGDCNGEGAFNIADAVFLLGVLFPAPGAPQTIPECDDACDANDDGALNIADAVAILDALFGSPPTPIPPPTGTCGDDLNTPDMLSCVTQPSC